MNLICMEDLPNISKATYLEVSKTCTIDLFPFAVVGMLVFFCFVCLMIGLTPYINEKKAMRIKNEVRNDG